MNNPQQLINEIIEGKKPEGTAEEKKKLQNEVDFKEWMNHPETQKRISHLLEGKKSLENGLLNCALNPSNTDSEVRVMAIRYANAVSIIKELTTI